MKYLPIESVNIRHSISTRLLKIVLSIYLIITFIMTCGHIYIEYSAAKNDIQKELEITESTFKNSISEIIWNIDDQHLKLSAEGITKFPSVIGVEILNHNGVLLQRAGVTPSDQTPLTSDIFWHEFPLYYSDIKIPELVGRVRLFSSNGIVFNRIKIGVIILFISALIKTLALVALIIIVFNRLLSRPLGQLANDAEGIDLNDIQSNHIKIHAQEGSELKILEKALNNMIDKITTSMSELESLNKDLESKVVERTKSLNETVKQLDSEQQALTREAAIRMEKEKALLKGRVELERSLEDLKQAQAQLIESEKMASLGELVAGVAHEINTPVGLSLTGVSHFQYMLEKLEKRYTEDDLEEDQFEKFLADANEIAQSVHVSLDRAANLVKSFKQVAVDQSHEVVRWFNVDEYINEVMLSLGSKIKHSRVNIEIKCDKSIEIRSYPGSLSQIVTNFINNSLTHAYTKNQEGTIKLVFEQRADHLFFEYSDDGTGQEKEVVSKMFNPFFTTNRENGGSGLGLNIVYNLITQKMKGTIQVVSNPDSGTTFTTIIPVDLNNENN